MPLSSLRRRPAAVVACIAFASLLSCGREFTGPGRPGTPATVQLNPVLGSIRLAGDGRVMSIGEVVDFASVRVVLVRTSGDTVIDRVVPFPADSTSIRLSFVVSLSQAATTEGEPLEATLKYINATGDTVFTGGPIAIIASTASAPPPPPTIPVEYTGPGADAASIAIAPTSHTGTIGQQVPFAAVVRDSSDATMNGVPVAYTSTDSTIVSVDLRTGLATLVGARGTARIIAQTLTGQEDTAVVTIDPTPNALVVVSGGNQSTRQTEAFPNPIRVRVNAIDGLPVANVPVSFTVTRGQGSAAPAVDTTDALGIAEATWTAGDSAGIGNLTVAVVGRPISAVVTGNQLSSAPSSLTFETQPPSFASGDTIAPLVVVVRDATADTVAGFNGTVTLDLTGGTAGVNIIGVTSREAVNGVATFPGLTLDGAGTAFRFRATTAGVTPVLSNTFNVAAAPPRYIAVLQGSGQTAPASTPLPDSIVVRVTNVFAQPVSGVGVTFAVALGGGAVSPAAVLTDANGRAATRWTIGADGVQQLTASVVGLQPTVVNAAIFVPEGSPTLYSATGVVAVTVATTRGVPIFVTPAAVVPVVAQLTMLDTAVAAWTQDSVVFTAGATLRSPTIIGRAVGATRAVITSPIGSDTVDVEVAAASLDLSGYSSGGALAGDTLRKTVRINAPAPVGGLTVTVASTDPNVLLVAPGSGRGAPADECDEFFCYDDRAPGVPTSAILAPPAESTTVVIPEGQTSAQVVILTVGEGTANVRVSAPSFATDDQTIFVEAPQLSTYFYSSGVAIQEGAVLPFEVSLPSDLRRDLRVTLTSRDSMVVAVDSVTVLPAYDSRRWDLTLRGRGPGSTWIVASAPGFLPDSFEVLGGRRFVYFGQRGPFYSVGERPSLQFSTASDSLGSQYSNVAFSDDIVASATSSDPGVVRVDFVERMKAGEYYGYVRLHAVAPGTAWIHLAGPGVGADSVPVTVGGVSLTVFGSSMRVGTGQVNEQIQAYAGSGSGDAADDQVLMHITSSDPSIAEVLTPELYSEYNRAFGTIRILGRAPGTVTLTFAGPQTDTVTHSFTVVAPRIQTGGLLSSGGTYDPDSGAFGVFAYVGDDIGGLHDAADVVQATIRSTDPSVLQVTDSTLTGTPGSISLPGGVIRFIAPGTARIIVEAPGMVPDTSPVFTVRPFRLESTTSIVVGAHLRTNASVFRRGPSGAALPFTITVSGTGAAQPRQLTDTIPAGAVSRAITIDAGGVIGTNTLIYTAAGFAPDTTTVTVQASYARPSLQPSAPVGTEVEVAAGLDRVGGFALRAPSDTVALVLSASDSSMIAVLVDTVRIAPGDGGATFAPGVIRFLRPGISYIRFTDPSGRFTADSQVVQGERRSLYASPSRVDLGMQTTTYSSELYLYRQYADTVPLWVRLTSSAPDIAQPVQDSVLIPAYSHYAYYELTGGDTVGGAIITASAPGFVDVHIEVAVSRTVLTVGLVGSASIGRSVRADVYQRSFHTYDVRPTTVAVPVRLRSEDTTVARIDADSLGEIPVGEGWLLDQLGPLVGVRAGTTRIFAEDRRTGAFQQSLSTDELIAVAPAVLRQQGGSYRVALGAAAMTGYVETDMWDSEGLWVHLRALGGRVRLEADSVFIQPFGSSYYFAMSGISAGIDTIVVSAPGFAPDSMMAVVSDARLFAPTMPAAIRTTDSTQVTVYFQTENGTYATIDDAPRTFTFSVSGSAHVTLDGTSTPLTTFIAPPGTDSITFWVRANSSGPGELTITAPGFRPLRARFDAPLGIPGN